MPKRSHSRSSSNEPALGSSGGSKQEDQAPAAPPSTPLWLLQAEIERVELTLTLKLPADVCGLVTAFLAKPRGLIDEVLETMIASLKGHTHEDIDAVFSIMAGSIKDLLTWDTSMQMAESLRPIPVCRGPIEGVRDWRSWLDGLVFIQSKRGVENITEARWLAFVRRADAPLKWANFAPVPALGSTGTSPNDVMLLLTQFMSNADLMQPPELMLTAGASAMLQPLAGPNAWDYREDIDVQQIQRLCEKMELLCLSRAPVISYLKEWMARPRVPTMPSRTPTPTAAAAEPATLRYHCRDRN